MNFPRSVVAAILISIAISALAAPRQMSPLAQEPFDKGLLLAQRQQWQGAIRSLTEAQKFAPDDPAVAFNLGLAHAKAGQELAAIAWLQAYLALSPKASNAAAVLKEIRQLEMGVQEKIRRILTEAISVAPNFSPVRDAQAATGDVEEAIKGGLAADKAWFEYATALRQVWALEKLERAMTHLTAEQRQRIHDSLFDSLRLGPPSGFEAGYARMMAARISDPRVRTALVARLLASSELQKGDLLLAEATFKEIGERAHGIVSEALLTAILRLHMREPDQTKTLRFVEQAIQGRHSIENADVITDVLIRDHLLRGNLAQAKTVAAKLAPVVTGLFKAKVDAVLGNFDAAIFAANEFGCEGRWQQPAGRYVASKGRVLYWLQLVQVASGDHTQAEKTMRDFYKECVNIAPNRNPRADVVRHLAWLRLAQGDTPGFLNAMRELQSFKDQVIGVPEIQIGDFLSGMNTKNLKSIETVLTEICSRPHFVRDLRPMMELAAEYRKRGNTADADRLTLEAANALLTYMGRQGKGPWPQLNDLQPGDFAQMLRAAGAAGERDIARALTLYARGQPAIELARKVSLDETTADIGGALKTAAAHPQLPALKLAEVARHLAVALFNLQARAPRPAMR